MNPASHLSRAQQAPTQAPVTLVICGIALAYDAGGLPAHVHRLIGGLARRDEPWILRLMVVEGTPLENIPSRVQIETVPRALTNIRPFVSQIATCIKLGTIAARRYPDAVFITPTDFWAPRVPRRRIAVTLDAIPELYPASRDTLIRRLHRRFCLRYARSATRWLTISEAAAHDISRIWGRGQSPVVVANWIESALEQPVPPAAVDSLRARLGLPERFYLYVGGYRGYKNVEMLIRAHAAAARRATIPPLVLAGRIPASPECGKYSDVAGEIARSGAAPDSILRPGFIADADMPALYAAATLFVSASLHEGFGYPPVEAMAAGCPVLVADRTSFREVVSRAECRFDPDNETQLVEALLSAAKDPEPFRCPFPLEFGESAGIARFVSQVKGVIGNRAL